MNTMTAYYDTLPEGADKMDNVVQMTYVDAVSYLSKNGFDAPDPADFGVWVPGIPVLIGNGLEAAGAADWLNGLILDGIVAGVGAVLGFVPQMLVLFLMLAFLEACGYMARIAFVGPYLPQVRPVRQELHPHADRYRLRRARHHGFPYH